MSGSGGEISTSWHWASALVEHQRGAHSGESTHCSKVFQGRRRLRDGTKLGRREGSEGGSVQEGGGNGGRNLSLNPIPFLSLGALHRSQFWCYPQGDLQLHPWHCRIQQWPFWCCHTVGKHRIGLSECTPEWVTGVHSSHCKSLNLVHAQGEKDRQPCEKHGKFARVFLCAKVNHSWGFYGSLVIVAPLLITNFFCCCRMSMLIYLSLCAL